MAGLQVVLSLKRELILVTKPVSHVEGGPYVVSVEDGLAHQASTAVCNSALDVGSKTHLTDSIKDNRKTIQIRIEFIFLLAKLKIRQFRLV